MAYLTQISDDNYIYSYSGVSGSILKEYLTPAGIEAYLFDESFSETVRQSYIFCRDTEPQWMDAEVKRRFENQKNKTAEWLRRQVRDMRSYRSQPRVSVFSNQTHISREREPRRTQKQE